MREEDKLAILAHISMIETYIRKLHEQVHTGIMRVSDGTALLALERCLDIKSLINLGK